MDHEIHIRIGAFLGVFAVMSVWEIVGPRRPLTTSKKTRWFANLVILSLNPILVRLLFPAVPIAMARLAQEQNWGMLNNMNLPYWFEVILAVIILDLVIYLQHVLFHAIPTLWRLHMMHHSDLDFDLTTGLRFHPIEIIISMLIKLTAVVALGPAPLGVLLFEVLLNGTSMFNHSNVRLPLPIDRVIRLLVVTPDMHRVHHSVVIRETNSNFGFNLPWWDRLLGTYKAQPEKGHDQMTIGLAQFRDAKRLALPWLLALPFVGDPGRQSINRH